MKLKIDGNKLTTLTLRAISQVEATSHHALHVSQSLLPLKPAPDRSGSSVDVSIQGTPKGKEKAREDDEAELTKEKWERESEQMVAELYSHVASIY